jgi:hypothetical protein
VNGAGYVATAKVRLGDGRQQTWRIHEDSLLEFDDRQ